MMSVTSDCQILVEEDEDDEMPRAELNKIPRAELNKIPRAELNRQLGKRHRFSLYEKMLAVRQIQQHL
jgi:hypothetical protein